MPTLTKPISWNEYIGDKKMPRLLTTKDMIDYLVSKEEQEIETIYELPEHKEVKVLKKWDAGLYNFVKSILP